MKRKPKLQLVKGGDAPGRPTLRDEIKHLARKHIFAGLSPSSYEANALVVLRALTSDDSKLVDEVAAFARNAIGHAERRAAKAFRHEWLARLADWDGTHARKLARDFVEAGVLEFRLEHWLQVAHYSPDVSALESAVADALTREFERPRKQRKDATATPGRALLSSALQAVGLNARQIDHMLDYKRKG